MPVRTSGHKISLAAAALAFALSGCASSLDSLNLADLKLKNPFVTDTVAPVGPRRVLQPVTAADLVGPDGNCASAAPASAEANAAPAPSAAPTAAAPAAAAPAAAAVQPPATSERSSNQALYFTAGPEAGSNGPAPSAAPPELRQGPSRGIALEMTECDVVRIAGPTPNVQIGAKASGERTVTLTYLTGERPGIYHFVSGRLKTMERVPEPQVAAKPARRAKSARTKAQ